MRLETIRLRDFYAYEDLDLDLRGIGTLAVHGPVGSGKSTLVEALTWALYGRARQRDEGLIREGAGSTEVAVGFAARGHEIVVTRSRERGRTGKLRLEIDGEDRTRHTIAETEAALVDLVGLSYEALLAGPVQRQMMPGQTSAGLLDMAPRDRKDLLGELFGLGDYAGFQAAAKLEREEADKRIAVEQRALAAAQEIVDGRERHERDHAEATRASDLAAEAEAEADAKLRVLADQLLAATERRSRIEHDIQALGPLEDNLRRVKDQIRRAREARDAAAKQLLATPPDEPVPTGNVDDDCVERVAYAAAEMRWRSQREHAEQALARAEQDEQQAMERGRSDLERYRTLVAQREALGTLTDDDARAAAIRQEQGQWEATRSLARQTMREADRRAAAAAAMLGLVDDAQRKADAARAALEAQERRRIVYGTLERAFGRDGIPLLVLEAGIPAIEDRANRILERLGAFRIRLVTQRQKAAGGTRDTLEVEVQRDGRTRDYEGLSGGQRFQVDLALRLGLADVLTSRTGSRIETLVIDEGFGSQDTDGIEALTSAIAALADDFGIIIVVSHVEGITERFEARLEVTMPDGETSSATLTA